MNGINPDKCPRCGAPLPLDPPRVCARCALIDAQESPTDESDSQTPEQPPDCVVNYNPGDYIDQYKVLKQIGEGGSGIVYLAEDHNLNDRQVALKVLKQGMDTNEAISRFKVELQALVQLEHSHIARVYGSGITSAGQPYFAMELVRGRSITEYCDNRRLTLPQRLELFVKVCNAAYFAHRYGIIHRDIKPSNILVVEESGAPLPKMIDFGIAKAMSTQGQTDNNVITAREQVIGTPAYMSPEQAGLKGTKRDSHTDI